MKLNTNTKVTKMAALACLTAFLTLGASCGETGGFAGTGVRSYVGSADPGDVWEWTLDYIGGTFVARIEKDGDDVYDLQVEGTLVTLPSGFVKGTPTTCTALTSYTTQAAFELECPTDGTGYFYGLEAPGLVFIIKPEGTIKGDLIATVAKDNVCKTDDYNWIKLGFGNDSNSSDATATDMFGNAAITGPLSAMSLTGEQFDLGANFNTKRGDITPPTISCSNGKMTFDNGGGDIAVGQITLAGAMVIDQGPGQGGIIAFEQSSVSLNDMTDGLTYTGIVFHPNTDANSSDNTQPVQLVFNADGTSGVGKPFDNVETGAVNATEGATLHFTSITNGLLRGTIDYNGGGAGNKLAAIGYKSGDTRVLFATGIEDDGATPFMVLLVSN